MLLMASICAPACGGGSSSVTAPSSPQLTGTWTGGGFFTDSVLTLTLTHTGSLLTGTWTDMQPMGSGPYGTATGNLNGFNVSMTFHVGVDTPDCTFPIKVNAVVNTSGNQISGPYSTMNCQLLLSGNLHLTKQ